MKIKERNARALFRAVRAWLDWCDDVDSVDLTDLDALRDRGGRAKEVALESAIRKAVRSIESAK